MSQAVTFGVVLLVVAAALGGVQYYTWNITNTQVAQDRATSSSEVAGLQSSINSLQSTLAQYQQAQSSNTQQVASIQSSLQVLQGKLSSVGSQLNSTQLTGAAEQQSLSLLLQNMSATMKTLTAKVNSLTAQIPIATLVVTNDIYNSATKTFSFSVQNTQNSTVLAQISVQVTGNCGCGYSNMGFFISPVYQFAPHAISAAQYNTTLTSFNGYDTNQNPMDFSLSLVTGNNVVVSPAYTFQYP